MNKTRIEWTNFSWNPVTGCLHNCWYCYAKKMFTRFHKSFEPTFYPERLIEIDNMKKPCKIFVCSVSDLFAKWTKPEWRDEILSKILNQKYSHLTFQLLTKNPENIDKKTLFNPNIWIGTTVTSQDEIKNIDEIKQVNAQVKFVSFEPLLGDINCDLTGIDWVIIGKLTGSSKVKLQNIWVENLLKQTKRLHIPVFIKNNVKWDTKIQEYP